MLLHLFSTKFYYYNTSLSPWPLNKPEQIWIGLWIDLVAMVQSLQISLFEWPLHATATLWYGELLPLVPEQNVQTSWLSQRQRVQAIRDDATVRFRRRWMFYVGLVHPGPKIRFPWQLMLTGHILWSGMVVPVRQKRPPSLLFKTIWPVCPTSEELAPLSAVCVISLKFKPVHS